MARTRWQRLHQKPQPLKTLLRPYRREALAYGVPLLAGMVDAPRLIAAVELCGLPRWKRPEAPMPEEHRARWLWLWTGYSGAPHAPVFLRRLAAAAGLSPELARALWPPVATSRIVLPGGAGTVNRAALRSLIATNASLAAQHITHEPVTEDDERGDEEFR